MKVAIIGAGPMAKIIAEKARQLGVETYCFAWEQGAVAKDAVDHFVDISIFEKDAILKICREEQVSGVIATTELTIAIAAYIANEMGLCANPIEIAQNLTNKFWVREHNQNAVEFCQPRYWHITHQEQSAQQSIDRYPVIVKPVAEGGKRGITVVSGPEQLEAAVNAAFDADKRDGGILIEEYLDGGKEYSVEGLSFEGKHQIIQITEKISSGPPHCVELGHSQPAALSPELWKAVERAIVELLNNVGIKYGPTHTEIKIRDGRVYLIELNSRPGGDHIAYPLTELSTGYDYIGQIIYAAAGQVPALRDKTKPMKYAGVRFITKQTAEWKSVFDHCDNKKWLYRKHEESKTLDELEHNNGFHTNYFIYCDDVMPDFKAE